MKIKIYSTNFDLMYGSGKKFIEKYGEKLAQYKLKVVAGNRYCTAYIFVSSLQKLVRLPKVLEEEIIVGYDGDEPCIEIYDKYRE